MLDSNETTRKSLGAGAFFREAGRRLVAAGVCGALVLSLAACGGGSVDSSGEAEAKAVESAQVDEVAADETSTADDTAADADEGSYYEVAAAFSIDTSDLFSKRDLDASYDEASATKIKLADGGATVKGKGATADGSEVTITEAGTYVLSGSLADGRLVVDVADDAKVQLVLDGATIASSSGTALYVRNADKVFLTLADGSHNELSSAGASAEEDDHTLDGCVFAADDLTINGAGNLKVSSAEGNGIVAKDELTLVSGSVEVKAAGHALEAKDSLAARDGSYVLEAGKDGVHVEHDTNGTKGFAYIAGGTWSISAADDGIHASNDVLVDGGTITVDAEDDGIHSEYDLVINDGAIDVTQSYEGLEGARVEQNGGDVHVVASDDGVNAAGEPTAEEDQRKAEMEAKAEADAKAEDGADGAAEDGADEQLGGEQMTREDGEGPREDGFGSEMPQGQMPEGETGFGGPGMHPDGQMPEGMEMPTDGGPGGRDMGRGPRMMSDGQIDGQMPEGMEMPQDGQMGGQMPQDGEMPQDGQMPEDGMGQNGGHGFGGGMGGMMMDADATASLVINGGKLVVEAGGDGLDSNGTLVVNGGETYVSGPTNNGNGPLDYGISATVTGGVLVAAGSSGMAETFGADSTQGSLLVSATGNAGDLIEIKDASGKVLASYTTTKQYSCITATAPGMVAGETYTVAFGGQEKTVTLDSITFSDVRGGMMGGMR